MRLQRAFARETCVRHKTPNEGQKAKTNGVRQDGDVPFVRMRKAETNRKHAPRRHKRELQTDTIAEELRNVDQK